LAVNVYEGLFIFDSNRYGRDQSGVSGQLDTIISEVGGEVLATRLWEERRLAYPIKRQRKGTYWLTYFRLDSEQVKTINRRFQLSDSILRSLVLKVDPRIVDTLVSHALPKPEAEKPTPKPAAVDGDAKAEKKDDAKGEAKDDAKSEVKVEAEGDATQKTGAEDQETSVTSS